MSEKDYYKILGVNENAGPEDTKKAYRNLAFRYHPDRSAGNEELMKEINEAYAVLSNPSKKKEYDTLKQRYGSFARDQFRQSYTDRDIFRDSDIGRVFEEFSRTFGFSRPEDIFTRSSFYGSQYRTFEFRGPGFSGSAFFIYGPMRKAIEERLKAGHRHPFLSTVMLKGLDLFQKLAAKKLGIDLPVRGKARYGAIKISTEEAFGGGKVQYLDKNQRNPRQLLIKVPPGIRDGQTIKLKGLGEEGKSGGEHGDLYLKVTIRTSLFEKISKLFRN
jgi:DnaJ-class molecular chaperone